MILNYLLAISKIPIPNFFIVPCRGVSVVNSAREERNSKCKVHLRLHNSRFSTISVDKVNAWDHNKLYIRCRNLKAPTSLALKRHPEHLSSRTSNPNYQARIVIFMFRSTLRFLRMIERLFKSLLRWIMLCLCSLQNKY